MDEKALYKKYYKHPAHDYELEDTTSVMDDTGRHPDICFIYSGRERGKSYEVTMRAITDAYYHDRLFGYIRRHIATNTEVEEYFGDKTQLIKDMTDGASEGITVSKGWLYLYTYSDDLKGGYKKILQKKLGKVYFMARAASYRSLQTPEIMTLIVEEVLTEEEPFLQNEPDRLLNIYSSVGRSREGFRMYCISNTVSAINPYSKAWNLAFTRTKPNQIRLNKLYLGRYDDNGGEEYLLIASHYLKDKGDLTAEDRKKNEKQRVKTGIHSNRWDEARLYHHVNYRYMKPYRTVQRAIFEWDDVQFMAEIKQVPDNILDMFMWEAEESSHKIYVLYISRKTSEPHQNTRVYTNNSERLNRMTTRGFRSICKIDEVVEDLTKRGWIIGTDNLCMNDFMKVYQNLRLLIK